MAIVFTFFTIMGAGIYGEEIIWKTEYKTDGTEISPSAVTIVFGVLLGIIMFAFIIIFCCCVYPYRKLRDE